MDKARLLKLCDRLESGVQGHKYFDFSTYDSPCGTRGCALGECPVLWPNEWEWLTQLTSTGRLPSLKAVHESDDLEVHGPSTITIYHASVFFDITMREADSLFIPGRINACGMEASAVAVSQQIRQFIHEKEGSHGS